MINDDLRKTITENQLPADIIKDANRVASLYHALDGIKTMFDLLLNKQAIDCPMTIEECSNLMKTIFISEKIDRELIRKMVQQARTSEDVKRILTAALHYRQGDIYHGIVVKELANPEIKLDHKVWYEILTYKDPWYFRISNSLEKLVLIKVFEGAPEAELIANICRDYTKKSSFSTSIMLLALSNTQLSVDTWKEISYRSEKKVKEITEEKINQWRKMENHQLCQT